MNNQFSGRKSQKGMISEQGFTLIEILVSIVVLSFGLLGMVGIQALALKSNNDAKLQSSAVRMSKELSDMMRGNKNVAIATTAAANPYLQDLDFSSMATVVPNDEGICFGSGTALCTTPLKIAKWEIKDWLTRLNSEFPGVHVKICFDASPYDTSGLPQWSCSDTGDSIAIKIGWARASTDSTKTGANAFDAAVRPSVVVSSTPGSST